MKNKRRSSSSSSSSSAFFLCFTMRNPNSQPLASPNRHSTSSLYASLSRRLSLHSSSSHRKSSSSETAEPTSPKVTCIGQVKIKSKRKSDSGNNQHLVNRSRSGRDTSSFRRREVKAVSICDALSCFMPASCFGWNSCYYDSNGSGKKDQRKCDGNRRRKRYSCGTVFIRWLMAMDGGEEEEEGKKVENSNDFREMDFFAREIEEEDELENAFSRKKEEENEEEDVEVNVCVPPKNALLLMRCRSDPVRMAALSTRFWDSPAMKVDCKQENGGEIEIEKVEKQVVLDEGLKIEEDKNAVAKGESVEVAVLEKIVESKGIDIVETVVKKIDESEDREVVLRRSISCSMSSSIGLSKLKGGDKRRSFSYREKEKRRDSISVEKESKRHSFCSEKEARRSSFSGSNSKETKKRWSFSFEKESLGLEHKTSVLHSLKEAKAEETTPLEEESIKVIEHPKVESSKKEETQIVKKGKKPSETPDCLLLMMYEPKLSMEVSKETWVCNTDFVHQRRNQQPKPKHERKVVEKEAIKEDDINYAENENAITSVHQTQTEQPSIISPMERKLLKSLAVSTLPQAQHLVLTRCKSEPGKSSARLVADTCFWKARHQPIGPVGLGF